LNIIGNFYNSDTLTGSALGNVTVSNVSSNDGIMKGAFEFCDLTPPLIAPFIDINTGTIEPNITWCAAVGLTNSDANSFTVVFPNPTNGNFTIKTSSDDLISITNEIGQNVYLAKLSNNNNHTIEIQDLNAGIYFIKSIKNNSHQRIVITK
jgi:hypothetical protein